MSVARVREINARLRAAGITVHEWAGWESRGNGQAAAYEGGIIHNTVTPFGFTYPTLITGRADLAGPLCNWGGNEDGSLTVVAAHPANHAGASGGRSMGPLPVTTTFNRRVLGLEFVAPGSAPLRPAQYRTGLIWARIVADVVGGGDIERVRAHFETSITGKIDISMSVSPVRSYDMRALRAEAATVLTTTGGSTPMALILTDWEQRVLAWQSQQYTPGKAGLVSAGPVYLTLLNVAAGITNLHTKVDALGVAMAQTRARVESFDPDNDGRVSVEAEQAAQGDWAAVVEAARQGAREGVTKDFLARIDALEQALQADDVEQAREGARQALAGLRAALPADTASSATEARQG